MAKGRPKKKIPAIPAKGTYGDRVMRKIIQNQINKNLETKELTYNYTNVGSSNFSSISYGSTAIVAGLFGAIAQGVNDGQRIGNSLFARGVNVHFAIQNASADITNQVRFIFFQPKKGMATNIQPTSTASFVQSVLSGAPSGATQWLQPVDTDRFEVLLDKVYYLKNTAVDGSSSATAVSTRFLRKFIPINKKIQWDDSGQINNDVYVIAISDSAAVPNPGAVAGYIRVYYKDA